MLRKKQKNIILSALKRIKSDMLGKPIFTVFLVLLFAFLFWQSDLSAALLWVLFFAFFLYDWENRIIAALALLALAICPFLLIYKKENLAEIAAIYAYYFLVMTVVLQMAELKRHPERFEEKIVNSE